jgi:hypothetical protein
MRNWQDIYPTDMGSISTLFANRPQQPRKATSERGELLKMFLRKLTPHWDAKRFGKLTIPRIARKLEGIPTKDLYYLDRVCEDSKNYAKRFFWEINPSKHSGA